MGLWGALWGHVVTMYKLQYKHAIASHDSCARVLPLILQGRGQDRLPTPHIYKAQQASITQNIGLDAVYIGYILLKWKDKNLCYTSWIRVNQGCSPEIESAGEAWQAVRSLKK